MQNRSLLNLLTLCGSALLTSASMACPLCAVAVESNKNSGGNLGDAINISIYFMLSMPILLTGVLVTGLFVMIRRQPSYLPGELNENELPAE